MGQPSRRKGNNRDKRSVISHIIIAILLIYASAQVLVVVAGPPMPILSYMLLALQHTLFITTSVVVALILMYAIERASNTNGSV